jgi:tetratricopeptide (TPR) repeat protein
VDGEFEGGSSAQAQPVEAWGGALHTVTPLSRLVPIALLAVFAALAIGAMAQMSITGDEVTHLPAGYSYVTTGDFRMNMQHPPLIKVLAALPLLTLDLTPVREVRGWQRGREWLFGRTFLTHNRVPLQRIVFLARLPMVAVGVLLGALIFLWARDLWGAAPANLVLLLYVLSPNFLAHAPIVHTDVGVTCFTVMSVYGAWKLCRTGKWRWTLYTGIAVGFALLAKYSGVVTFGIVGLLLAGFGISPQRHRDTENEISSSPSPCLCASVVVQVSSPSRTRIIIAGLLIAAIALLLVAFAFGFPNGLSNYVTGFRRIHADANPRWQGFLWGRYSPTGFWYYYLLAQLWKMPIPALLFSFAGLLVARRVGEASRRDWWFLLLPILAFEAAAAWKHPSIGVRHIFPVFPFFFLIAGAFFTWALRRGWLWRGAIAVLFLWQAVGTLRMYPHFLPYFNELAGGPSHGIAYLDDSNIEWGQAYYALADYAAKHRGDEMRFLAFEPIDRSYYGIEAPKMDLRDVVWPRPGVTYLAGASFLQRNSLFEDPSEVRFHWLELYQPVERIAWSIYVYRFSVDPADANRPDVFYIPRQRWYEQAIAQLAPIVGAHVDFRYGRDVLAEVYSDRAGWRAGSGDGEGALLDRLAAAQQAPWEVRYRVELNQAVNRMAGSIPVDDKVSAGEYYEKAFQYGDREVGNQLLALLRCQRRDPHHLGAAFNLGQLFARLGFYGMAEQWWKRSLVIEPGYEPALKSLAAAEHARQTAGGAASGGVK